MKIIFLLFLLLCSVFGVYGQHTIQGSTSNSQQKLPFATAFLLTSDSIILKGVVANALGQFIFEDVKPGRYRVSSSMLGYTAFCSESFGVTESILLPEIVLHEAATELDEIIINAEKPIFSQQSDRLVLNVQNSITASGNTMLEILQKSPGVVVNRQSGNIAMNEKSGVRVAINGRAVQVPPDVLVQMLDGMSASNVEKIELIATPPSNYDADGNGGIINIVTKEDVELGTKGSAGFTVGARWRETLGVNFNLNYRNKRFAYFLDYSILKNHNLHTMKMERQFLNGTLMQTINSSSRRANLTTQHNLMAGLEWSLGKYSSLNIMISSNRRNWKLNAQTNDENRVSADSSVITVVDIDELNIWQSVGGAIGFQTTSGSKTSLGIAFDYFYYHNNNPSYYNNKTLNERNNKYSNWEIDLKKKTPIHFLIGTADFQWQVSSGFTVEAGIKAVKSSLDNNVVVQRHESNEWAIDPEFTSFASLTEEIAASYLNTTWDAGRQWQINSGLRYEYTLTVINTPEQKKYLSRRYGNLFPLLIFKKKWESERDFYFSYARRITRPTYNDIAPYVFFWSPTTFSAGNPELYPAIAETLTAGYQVKNLGFSLQFNHVRNEILSLQPKVDHLSNTLTFRSENLKYLNTFGISGSYSIQITPWWEAKIYLTPQYKVAETLHLENNIKLALFGLNLNSVHQIRLPKNFSVEISGTYQSGLVYYLPFGSLNAGIQKSFGEKGVFRLSMDDILYTSPWSIRINSPPNGLDYIFRYDPHNQFIRLTYSKSFGNDKMASIKKKSNSEEERRRIE